MLKKPHERPTKAEVQAQRKLLRDNGMINQDAQRLVRIDRTKRENTDDLCSWIRTREEQP